MLRIRPDIVASIAAADSAAALHDHLQGAVELEHATIPPYLTALFSIKPGTNQVAAAVLTSVVTQEMLHMTIAANILNALGGTPQFDRPGFIPIYPGPLPMGVGDRLTVGLAKLTRDVVYDVFMQIEEPESPISIPVMAPEFAFATLAEPAPEYATIGQFYEAIKQKIIEIGDGAFVGSPDRQVVDTTWFPADQLFPVTNVRTAAAAIDVIVHQGEGTSTSPEDGGEPAHYYRFAQLVFARMLEVDPSDPVGWSYSGPQVGIDPAGVWDLLPNAKVADYPAGSKAQILGDQVNRSYTHLLRSLQVTFDGEPGALKGALALMFELNLMASELVTVPLRGTLFQAAPTFEYTPI